MAFLQTRVHALACCYLLRRFNISPATIINVGCSSAPELEIWQWLQPQAKLIGIDPDCRRHWPEDWYIKAAAVKEKPSGDATEFCCRCHSVYCADPVAHRKRHSMAAAVTIDEVAAQHAGPYFLWLDCEGGELDSLQGGLKTLATVKVLSVECRPFDWDKDYPRKLHSFLEAEGFDCWFEFVQDRIYVRKRRPTNR